MEGVIISVPLCEVQVPIGLEYVLVQVQSAYDSVAKH